MKDLDQITPFDRSHSAIVRRLGASSLLSREEIAKLESLQGETLTHARDYHLVRDGDLLECAIVVRAGWALRWHETADGTRQIINLYLPGEIFGQHVNFYRRAIHTVTALTDIEVARIGPEAILETYRTFPRLAAGFDWTAARSINILSERNVSLGARRADSRVLHFLLEVYLRLMATGDVDEDGYRMPLTQAMVGEVCGMSAVHTNRTMRELIRAGLLDWRRDRVRFPDLQAAVAACEFDDRFLAPFQTRLTQA